MLFGVGLATKIYLAVEAVDMRKGFEGLYGAVRDQLGHDPVSGHLFLFTNKTRTRLKALVWDGRHSVTMRSEELAMLVNGLDVKHTRQRNWYRKSA
jgi:transposase